MDQGASEFESLQGLYEDAFCVIGTMVFSLQQLVFSLTVLSDLKSKSSLIFLSFLLVAAAGENHSFAAESAALSNLMPLTITCVDSNQISDCQLALFHAEVLQRQAASLGEYACQSRLLGLGSELLMVSFKNGRDKSALAMLEDVKIFCKGL